MEKEDFIMRKAGQRNIQERGGRGRKKDAGKNRDLVFYPAVFVVKRKLVLKLFIFAVVEITTHMIQVKIFKRPSTSVNSDQC